jgi:hypothetical protein
MKKIASITILLLITGAMGFAQSLELYETVGGQDVKRQNGEVLIRELDARNPFTFYMKVKNVNTGSLSVYCKKAYMQILPSSENTFCWDVCYVPSVMVSKHPIVMKSQEIISKFDATYSSAGYSGDSRIRYVWFDGAKPTDSIGVEVVFRSRPMGLEESTMSSSEMAVSPNPANTFVKLSFKPSSSPCKLVLHDLLGSKLLEKSIEGYNQEITLNTTAFPDGIYFCMLESGGQVRVVKKIMIRH